MSEISPSALGEQFSADFQSKLAACTDPEQIKELCHSEELSRGLIKLDWDESFRIPVETPLPRGFATTVTIAGVKRVLEASSETELRQKEIELYRQIFAQPASGTEQPRDPATGQFRATVDGGTTQIETDLVNRVLSEQGIDPAALRDITAAREQKSWVDATNQFLATHPDWPGTAENTRVVGGIVQSDPALYDAEDKAAALDAAYKIAREKKLLVANPELERNARISNAKSPAEIREILNYRGDAGLWGR